MMKRYIFTPAMLIFAVACLNSCNEKTEPGTEKSQANAVASPVDNKVNTQVVLAVGSERFTMFELEKNFRIFKQKFIQNKHREPVKADIKDWVNQFVERAYVLADARKKGYYDRSDIQQVVESTTTFMLSQPHGILEQKMPGAAMPGVAGHNTDGERKKAVITNYHIKTAKAAAVMLNKAAIVSLWRKIYKNEKLHEVKKEEVADILNKQLATYRDPNGKPGNITVVRFLNFYNGLPLKRYLEDTASINMYVHQIAVSDYIIKDAQKMGLLNDPEFRLNKINFTNNVVYQKYMEEHLGADRGVTESDILNVYASVKKLMGHPTNIVYSIYTFSNAPNAYKALGLLRTRPDDTTVNLNSLSQKRHIKFDKNHSLLPDTLKKLIYRGRPGQRMPPIETNGYFTVLVIESAIGNEPFSVNDIRPYLLARAKEQRELIYCAQKAAELSKTLKAENNIDINTLAGSILTTSL